MSTTGFKILIINIIAVMAMNCSAPGNETKNDRSNLTEEVKRVGMVIRLREDMIDEYKKLHMDDNEGVRDLLTKYNIKNFNIFLHKLDDGHYYEFAYYEYAGDDFEGDMKKLAAEPRNKAWLEICNPMQIPLEGFDGWAEMERIYFHP